MRVFFFCMGGILGKALTLDQLQKRNWMLATRCFLCNIQEETLDNILLHLWHVLFSLFGVSWVLLSLVRETLLGWHGSFVGRKQKKVWGATPLCFFLTIWKEKNRRSLDDEEFFYQGRKTMFLCNLS